MTTNKYNLTIAEAAYVADIPEREVWRMTDDKILTNELMNIRKGRSVTLAASVLASFYYKGSDYLYKKYRIKVIKNLLEKYPNLAELDDSEVFRLQSESDDRWRIQVEELFIDMGIFAKESLERFEILQHTICSEQIMDGEPVMFRTRIPVKTIGFFVGNHLTYKEVTEHYPSIPSYELFQSAKIWSDLNFCMVAPKKISDIPANWKLKSATKAKFKLCKLPCP